MPDIRIKRGGSLSLTLSFAGADASPLALGGLVLTMQVRDAEERLVATLTPQPTSVVGQATVLVVDTSAWPEGMLRADVLAQSPGVAQTVSKTFAIYVDHAITQLLPALAPFDPVTDS